MWPRHLLILGCGNMGGAMLAGWLAGGAAPERFTVVDRSLAEAPAGVTLLRELPAAGDYDAVMLGVKPQALDKAGPDPSQFEFRVLHRGRGPAPRPCCRQLMTRPKDASPGRCAERRRRELRR